MNIRILFCTIVLERKRRRRLSIWNAHAFASRDFMDKILITERMRASRYFQRDIWNLSIVDFRL